MAAIEVPEAKSAEPNSPSVRLGQRHEKRSFTNPQEHVQGSQSRKKFGWGIIPILCILLLVLSGCGNDLGTARGVVEEFIDQHYVNINLKKAQEFCVGLALHKINEEIRLTEGQPIDASTRKPKIYYRLLEERVGTKRASFMYQGTIRVEDAGEFTRRWFINARKENGTWRVSNFKEF